jgi:4-methyl-5(b-hydroxyethyl)-thiazole monophosphate biosynthesis
MKKICIHLITGFEEIEAIVPGDILRRAGLEVEFVSLTKELLVEGAHQISVKADLLFEEVNYNFVDVILLPGGMPGASNLCEHKGLNEVIRKFHESGKYLAAICAAPMVLGKLGIMQGLKATCFAGFEKYLPGTEIVHRPVVVCNNFITARGPGSALKFGLKLVEIIKGKENADRIASAMVVE